MPTTIWQLSSVVQLLIHNWLIIGTGCFELHAQTRRLKAKFHHAIWSQTGSKLVAELQRAEIWPII